MNPYQVLGVRRNASLKTITAAYRRASKACHPDLHPGDPAAAARFREVQAAFEVLQDPERRRLFDQTGSVEQRGLTGSQVHEAALRLLAKAVHEAIGGLLKRGLDPEEHDVLGLLRKSVRSTVATLEKNQEEQERINRAVSGVAGRFQGPDSHLGPLTRGPLADLERALENIRLEVKIAKAAYDLLKNERFSPRERPAGRNYGPSPLSQVMGWREIYEAR